MSEIFVERLFEIPGGNVVARFKLPYLAPGGEFRCRWQIEWPHTACSKEAAGIDGVQALMLAMRSVQAELTESDEYKAGKLTFLNQTDLDLPPMWGRGGLYDAGPRPT